MLVCSKDLHACLAARLHMLLFHGHAHQQLDAAQLVSDSHKLIVFLYIITKYAHHKSASLHAGFSSDACPEGFVCVVKSTLRILTVENVGETFNQSACRLRYTPRKLLIHPESKNLIIGRLHASSALAASC